MEVWGHTRRLIVYLLHHHVKFTDTNKHEKVSAVNGEKGIKSIGNILRGVSVPLRDC